jgi:hypothetical protein
MVIDDLMDGFVSRVFEFSKTEESWRSLSGRRHSVFLHDNLF